MSVILGVDPGLVASRFWSRVAITSSTACWEWRGETTSQGYGHVRPQGKRGPRIGAHRVAYLLTCGEIADGMVVCHRCDNRLCVNPAHLFLGTQADNLADMRAKKRHVDPPRMAGSSNPSARLTEADVAEIRRRLAAGERQTAIAADYPVTNHTIHLIAKGKKWAP